MDGRFSALLTLKATVTTVYIERGFKMAAIDQYLRQILIATYGEEVRHSIHDAIKQNYMDVSDSVAQANAAADLAEQALADASTVIDEANAAAQTAETAAQDASTAVTNANAAVEAANTAVTNANKAVTNANTAAESANSAATSANEAASGANTAAQNANEKATLANTAAQNADTARNAANTAATNANEKATLANTAATNADTKAGLANDAADRANEISDTIDEKVSTDTETVTGNPITVETDSAQVAEKTAIKLEPKQDLHGYDHPWPAGGGKNKLPCAYITTQTINSIVCTVNRATDGALLSVNIKGQNTSGNAIFIMLDTDITLSGLLVIGGFDSARNSIYIDATFGTWTAGGSTYLKKDFGEGTTGNIYIRVPADFNSSEGETLYPYVYTDADYAVSSSFAPYSNICPISGWNGTKVTRTGVNVWDEEWERGGISQADGLNFDSTTLIRSKNYIPCSPSTNYYFKAPIYLRIIWYDSNKNYISYSEVNNVVKESPSNAAYLRFCTLSSYTTPYKNDICINYPSTDHDYHAYQGYTYEITFPTEAGTVYGGTLTIEKDGSGTLVVDRVKETFDGSNDEAWSRQSGSRDHMVISLKNPYTPIQSNEPVHAIANMAYPIAQSTSFIQIIDSTIIGSDQNNVILRYLYAGVTDTMDVQAFRAWLATNNLQVCYDLATPITYTLTAEQVKLLKGLNHVSTDGVSLELTVRKGTFATLDDVADISALFKIIADDYEQTNARLAELFNAIDTYGPQEETASEIAREILKSGAYFKSMADAADIVKEDE